MEAGAWSCGMVAGLVYDIPSVQELMDRIMGEADALITKRLGGVRCVALDLPFKSAFALSRSHWLGALSKLRRNKIHTQKLSAKLQKELICAKQSSFQQPVRPLVKPTVGHLTARLGQSLGAHAIKHAVERAGIDPAQVEDVIMGAALQMGSSAFNTARQCLIGSRASR